VLLAPEVMPVGFAIKELIVGDCGLFPVDEADDPQPISPTQASRTRTSVVLFRR